MSEGANWAGRNAIARRSASLKSPVDWDPFERLILRSGQVGRMTAWEYAMINAANVIGLNPKVWQNSAEEARVVAESMQDEQSKQLMLSIAKEYERAAELTRERPKRWRRKLYGIYAVFYTAHAAATVHCGVGTSIDVPLLSA